MLNRDFLHRNGFVCCYFHKVDSCLKTIGRYFVVVALHYAVVADLTLKVVNGKLGIVQWLASRNCNER